MKKNRYFLVFYTFIRGNAEGNGHCVFTTKGCYLNSKFVISNIEASKGGSAVLTNIIELSKADYDTFVNKL